MEKTMTQTDTQVKEKNKIKAQTETQTESRADAQENEYVWKNGHPTEEEVLCQSSCMGFFRLFNNLRKQRGIKLEQLVNGVMTRRMLSTIIKGDGYFSRESWEFLMHRMGALTDYFEAIVSRKELEDWREREDICLLVCESPKEARTKLEAYEKAHTKMTSMAKLFCLKIEWLLKKEIASPQVLYELACEAVCCTVKEEWQEQLSGLWLAPAELEAILLVSWSLGLLGETEKALFLFHQVWNYPKKKGWEDRMTQLLCPQAALVGMQLYQKFGEFQKAFDIGNSALELLRAQNSQRYAYPLFLSLIDAGEKLKEMNKTPENLQQLKDFKDAFQIVYQENHLPCMRVWQRGSVENCYDVSLVLKRMRLSLEKSQEEICTDENGNEFLQARHLSRIEKGENRPSKENFQLLTKKMGRTLDWIMPILETDSIETLSMRQDMIYLTNMRKWDEVQKILDVLCKKMGTEACQKPRIQQEIQSIRATKLFQTKMIQPKEAQEYCKKALACTFPLEWLSHRELPFLQREEGMIISDIADMYGKMGNIECAENLFQKLYEGYRPQQQFLKVNTPACSVILAEYSKFLGDNAQYQRTLEIDKNNLEHELAAYYIVLSGELLYNKAWDYYELDKEANKDAYRREFICAQRFAEFCNNEILIELFERRTKKYLGE